MKLIELDPTFLKLGGNGNFRQTDNIKEADGLMFLCPLCFKKNQYSDIGIHSVICWQPHVSQSIGPKPGRWSFAGTNYNDLTLKAGSSSILLNGGCNAHFFITNGEIIES